MTAEKKIVAKAKKLCVGPLCFSLRGFSILSGSVEISEQIITPIRLGIIFAIENSTDTSNEYIRTPIDLCVRHLIKPPRTSLCLMMLIKDWHLYPLSNVREELRVLERVSPGEYRLLI